MNIDPILTNTVNVNGCAYKISILFDEYVDESPREWSNVGILACHHNRYKLGDEESKLGYNFRSQLSVEGSWDEMEEWINLHYDPVIIKSVYMYDHGSISLSTKPFSCPWDSGQVGFIYATPELVKAAYGVEVITPETIVKCNEALEHEIKNYNRYLQGDVYGYQIEHDSSVIESCWGFYCSVEEVMEEAEAMLVSVTRKTA